jgi:WD repeat-containing protein 48
MSPTEKRTSYASRPSVERDDYFTSTIGPADSGAPKPATTPAAEEAKTPADTTADKAKDKAGDTGKSPSTPFGKKFRMSFGSKKLGRSASTTAQEKPAVVDEKEE